MTDSPVSIDEAIRRLQPRATLTDIHDTTYDGVYWLTFEVASGEKIALMVEAGDARTNGEKSPDTDLILGGVRGE